MWNVKRVQQTVWQSPFVANQPEQPTSLENCQMLLPPTLTYFQVPPQSCFVGTEEPMKWISPVETMMVQVD